MPELLYEKLALPDTCKLGKRVFKKLFLEHGDLTATDRKAFTDDIDVIWWQYTLKPSTIPVPAYEDEEREYHEIAVLQVDLKTQKRTTRIAEVIHRAIPYPVLVVLVYQPDATKHPSILLSLAHNRFSRAEKEAIVVDEFHHTDWFNQEAADGMSSVQSAFLDSMQLSTLPMTSLYNLYSAWVERVMALEAACLTGQFKLFAENELRDQRRRGLQECRTLDGRIAELRTAIKQETQFNRQVEMNTRMKQLEKRRNELLTLL
jgi:uncharacterized protein DUF4391